MGKRSEKGSKRTRSPKRSEKRSERMRSPKSEARREKKHSRKWEDPVSGSKFRVGHSGWAYSPHPPTSLSTLIDCKHLFPFLPLHSSCFLHPPIIIPLPLFATNPLLSLFCWHPLARIGGRAKRAHQKHKLCHERHRGASALFVVHGAGVKVGLWEYEGVVNVGEDLVHINF